ncbi:MAG: hypothetical protein FWG83_02330 [Oscillospiraceae bacterium]|nr:hypothetical protein [Oscillospiraceae bacterium]
MKMNSGNMEKMLETVSAKIGMPVEELKNALNKGDFDSIMAKMDPKGAKKFKDAVSNPDVADVLKNSPEMANFMKNMNEKKK